MHRTAPSLLPPAPRRPLGRALAPRRHLGTDVVTHDHTILTFVVAARLLAPLLMFRYPLPGLLASIIADGDRGPLHRFTDLSLEHYQLYDKSLDSWYLAVAYMSTLRNWADPTAIAIGRFLFLHRLAGVLLFTITGAHVFLFVFPAAFEAYFALYEGFRTRWSPARLDRRWLVRLALVATALKLPQEFWLHIARRGTTAWLERNVFVEPSLRQVAWFALLAALAAIGIDLVRRVLRRLPPPDHPTRLGTDADRPRETMGASG